MGSAGRPEPIVPGGAEPGAPTRVTLATLRRLAQAGEPFACLTCYDATAARWLARGGVHVLLVGDTAAEVVLGLERTIQMPLEVLVALTAAVKRGAPDRVVMADMPFMSYQAGPAEAMRNAGRFLSEGLADVVKVEADAALAPLVRRMTRAGIPVCAHVGSLPQRGALTGGYAPAGRTAAEAGRIVADAVALEEAGAALLLVEAVPEEVTGAVLARTSVPVIGIGAGPRCHGQVLVLHDLLGMTDRPPRFARPVARLGEEIARAGARWAEHVRARDLGARPYRMLPGESERFLTSLGLEAPHDGDGAGLARGQEGV
ncbi:MAG TPA: 3-methyl-2-oxobutanoate hydroxymethyltransferase [Phycisphaerales bacterium]|nr:3-methyl-2-oxobutanoate hydroxymethyltransferase [Phycisphaerales bacterium]